MEDDSMGFVERLSVAECQEARWVSCQGLSFPKSSVHTPSIKLPYGSHSPTLWVAYGAGAVLTGVTSLACE